MGEDPREIRQGIEQTREQMGETVEAIGYKADVPSRAKDKMSSITGRISGSTPDSGDMKRGAKRAAGVAQENPLGLAVGAAAAGFLAGLLVPTTEVENEKIGPLADQVKEKAAETGQEALQHGKDVAQEVAQNAKETVQESGQQHAEELKESAQGKAEETREEVTSV